MRLLHYGRLLRARLLRAKLAMTLAIIFVFVFIATVSFAQEQQERIVVERTFKAGLGTLIIDFSQIKGGGDFFIPVYNQATGKRAHEGYTGATKGDTVRMKLMPGTYSLSYQVKSQTRKMKDIVINKGETNTVTLLP
ncbi:MAG: hypothetical protein HY589_05010 [Candidatus Omnitrophica bacterium]|nr:hypothetical protein [Candidatus Omnitrophota bacterium]